MHERPASVADKTVDRVKSVPATEGARSQEAAGDEGPGGGDGTDPVARTFGPSALLTPANGITALRLIITPVFVATILLWGASWAAFSLGGVIALSDGADGWIARKQGATRSGAFLDPLADKVVVLAALAALVASGIIWWVPVAIIGVREVAMSVYRSVVGRHGISIPARTSAKVKTLVQDLAIGLCLAPPLAGHRTVLSAAIWVATALTVFSGAQYYLDGRRAASSVVSEQPGTTLATDPGAGGGPGDPGTAG